MRFSVPPFGRCRRRWFSLVPERVAPPARNLANVDPVVFPKAEKLVHETLEFHSRRRSGPKVRFLAVLLRPGLRSGQPEPGRPVPLDRLAQAFLERRGGLEAEEVRGPRGIEAAARLAVGLVRIPHEAPGEPGELHDQ